MHRIRNIHDFARKHNLLNLFTSGTSEKIPIVSACHLYRYDRILDRDTLSLAHLQWNDLDAFYRNRRWGELRRRANNVGGVWGPHETRVNLLMRSYQLFTFTKLTRLEATCNEHSVANAFQRKMQRKIILLAFRWGAESFPAQKLLRTGGCIWVCQDGLNWAPSSEAVLG